MRYTILIVDDEALEREGIALLVSRSERPFDSLKAGNGKEAVEMVKTHRIDAVLMDIQMPVLSGLEAAKQIKAANPDMAVVFLTAWGTFDFAKEALQIGALDYLVKPTDQETLNSTLDKLISFIEERRKPDERLKNVIGAFNRDFFASLKYGNVDEDKARQFFRLQHINLETGFAIVASNLSKNQLQNLQESDPVLKNTLLCYYSSSDRITVLFFTSDYEKLISRCEQVAQEEPIIQGIGEPFTDLSGIARSIHSASIARLLAGEQGLKTLRYREEYGFDAELAKQQIADAVSKVQAFVLAGELSAARQEAHVIMDVAQELPEPDETIYQTLLAFTYNMKAAIPYFFRTDPSKDSIWGMEIYLMDYIDAAVAAVKEDNKNKYSRSFAMVDRYLHLHYADQVGVNTLSDMMKINSSYFSKLFKEYFHKSFVEYLTDIRLEKAKALLLSGETVQSTAEKTGFSDHTYFARVFKQKYGASPTDYKKVQG